VNGPAMRGDEIPLSHHNLHIEWYITRRPFFLDFDAQSALFSATGLSDPVVLTNFRVGEGMFGRRAIVTKTRVKEAASDAHVS